MSARTVFDLSKWCFNPVNLFELNHSNVFQDRQYLDNKQEDHQKDPNDDEDIGHTQAECVWWRLVLPVRHNVEQPGKNEDDRRDC